MAAALCTNELWSALQPDDRLYYEKNSQEYSTQARTEKVDRELNDLARARGFSNWDQMKAQEQRDHALDVKIKPSWPRRAFLRLSYSTSHFLVSKRAFPSQHLRDMEAVELVDYVRNTPSHGTRGFTEIPLGCSSFSTVGTERAPGARP